MADTYDKINKAINDSNLNFSLSGTSLANSQYTADGYVIFETLNDESFGKLNPSDIVSVTNIDMSATVTQPNPRKPFKCNFSFNFSFNFNLKLPKINPDSPNLSLLYSIDNFSKEMAKINDILIDAIRSMNCCDIEDAYNHNVVPLFRWFADHPDIKNCSPDQDPETGSCGPSLGSETLPYVMLNIAETLIRIYAVVRPLACLLRPLPGNPWWPADFDLVKFIYGFLDFYDMYVDYIISGKLVNENLLDPARKFRQNIQNCITGKNSDQNTIHENVIKNTIRIASIQRQINNINTKILNLGKNSSNYLNKYEKIFSDYHIILDPFINDDIEIDTGDQIYKADDYTLSTIFNYFITCYEEMHVVDKAPTEDDQVLQNLKNFLDNYSDRSTLIDFITTYFPKLNDSANLIKKDNFPNENVFSLDAIYDIKAKPEEDMNKAINFWTTFFASFIPLIQDAYKYYSLHVQYKNQIKILKKTKDTLNKSIENLKNYMNPNNPGITSMNNIEASYRNLVAKSDNPGNLCNCIIYTLIDNPKEPALYDLTIFLKANTEKFLNKEAISWKLDDTPGSTILKTYMYPDSTFDNNSKNKPLYFSDKFIDTLDNETKEAIKSCTNDFSSAYTTSVNTSDFSGIIQVLKDYTTGNKNVTLGEASIAFLTYIDTKVDTELYKLPNYDNWNKAVDLYNPYTGSFNNSHKMLVFDKDFWPKSLKPSDYYMKYVIPLYSLLSTYKKFFRDIDNNFYNKVVNPDENNFNNAKQDALALLNSIPVYAQTADKIDKIKLNDYLRNSKKIFDAFFKTYTPIDVTKDPNEIKIRSYENVYNPHDPYIESIFGNSVEKIINDYIKKRKQIFTDNISLIYDKEYVYNFLSDLSSFIYGKDLFSDLTEIWVWEPLNIPCDCQIFCKIIQYLINLLLKGLSEILNSVLNAVIQWILNSWLGKLIKIILAKLKCIMMALNLDNDLRLIKNKTDELKESLKQRIHLYIDPNVCLLNLDENNDNPILNENPDDNFVEIINNTLNDVINQETNGGQNPGDLLPDSNFNVSTPTLNINPDTGEPEISTGVSTSNLAQPLFPAQITSGLPATLVLSDGVEVNATDPTTNFPLLNFKCNCTVETCNSCLTEDIITNTKTFLNS